MTLFLILSAFVFGILIGQHTGWQKGWDERGKWEKKFEPLMRERVKLEENLKWLRK